MDKIKVLFLSGFFSAEHWNGRQVNEMLRSLLIETGRFDAAICEETRGITSEFLSYYDAVLVNYEGKKNLTDPARRFGETTEKALYDFVRSGKGIIFYHGSVWVDENWPDEYKKMMGGYFRMRHGRRNPKNDFVINRVENTTGITKYMPDHWMIVGDDQFGGITWAEGSDTEILCSADDNAKDYDVPGFPPQHHPVDIPDGDLNRMPEINQPNPQAWVNRYGDGRSVTIGIGHGVGTIERPGFMTLFVRGAEWAATGRATILPPDRSGDKRLIPWPYYHHEINPAVSENHIG